MEKNPLVESNIATNFNELYESLSKGNFLQQLIKKSSSNNFQDISNLIEILKDPTSEFQRRNSDLLDIEEIKDVIGKYRILRDSLLDSNENETKKSLVEKLITAVLFSLYLQSQTENPDINQSSSKSIESTSKDELQNSNSTEISKDIDNVNDCETKEKPNKSKADTQYENVCELNIPLPNALVGHSYIHKLQTKDFTWGNLIIDSLSFEGGNPGLIWESYGFLSGIPKVSGNFNLRIEGRVDDNRYRIGAPITVIDESVELWEEIPSDQKCEYWKEDKKFNIREGELLSFAASIRGRSHARAGQCRDDDFSLNFDLKSGWHVVAIADGAGSAEFSRQGSLIAVEFVQSKLPILLKENFTLEIKELLNQNLNILEKDKDYHLLRDQIRKKLLYPTLVKVAFESAKEIEKVAKSKDRKPDLYSTTLIICVAKQIEDKWFVANFSIGDGGIAVLDKDKQKSQVLNEPDSGEFAGQTVFLHSSEFGGDENATKNTKRIKYCFCDNLVSIILATDGVIDPIFQSEESFKNIDKWTKLWNELEQEIDITETYSNLENQLLTWLEFYEKGYHDDRTIAILCPYERAKS